MSINVRPRLVEQLTVKDHSFLELTDECLFFAEFYAGKGFVGDGNKLITNLKKNTSKKGTVEWVYKEKAIEDCSNLIINGFGFELLKRCLFVPMPPSKTKDDPEYDDRLISILKRVQKKGLEKNYPIQYAELLSYNKSRERMSKTEFRFTPEEHLKNMKINLSLIENKSFDAIVIFDDVLLKLCTQ